MAFGKKFKMKNLLGYNIKSQDGRLDGEEFVLRRIDGALSSKQKNLEEEGAALEKSSAFPLWLSLLKYFFLLAGCILLGGGLDALSDDEALLADMEANGLWWIIGAGAAAILVGLVLALLEWRKGKIVKGSSAFLDFSERTKKLNAQSREALRVPENAAPIDVFTYPYKPRANGKASIFEPQYFLLEVAAFREGDLFCLSDVERVLGIPLDKIRRVLRVKKSAAFIGWNKETPPNKPPYKVRINQYGVHYAKPIYAVEIEGSEEFYLLFPPYEWEKIAPLLGDRAPNIEEVKRLS